VIERPREYAMGNPMTTVVKFLHRVQLETGVS
jgi:hypothetical protein